MFIQPISFGYTNSSKRIHTPEYSNNKYQLKNTNSLVLPFAYPNIRHVGVFTPTKMY